MRFFLLVSTFFSLALLTMHIALLPAEVCPSGVPEQYEHIEPGKVVSAYFLSWHGKELYTPDDFEKVAPKITHLMYAFAEPNTDGTCDFMHPKFAFGVGYNYEVEKGHFEKLREIKRKFPHLKILLSVGGGGGNQKFVQLYRSKLLKKVAKSFVNILDSHEYTYRRAKGEEKTTAIFSYEDLFDGIDINWEFSARGAKEGYAQSYLEFVKEVKKLLRRREKKVKKPMTLTATLQISPAVYRSLPIEAVAKEIDWFHVMSYDVYGLSSGSVGYNSPICGSYGLYTIDGAINRIIGEGVPPNKLVLGVPGYGYKYAETRGFGKPFNKEHKLTKAIPYRDIRNYFEESNSYEQGWSEKGLVPYLRNGNAKIFISYDNSNSVKEKVQLAASKRLAGVMFWALSHDDENHTLVTVLHEEVGKPMFL